MTLNLIDIASHQSTLDVTKIKADGVIVKATQGLNYVNPYCNKHVDQTLKSGKKLGLYHFAGGKDPVKEANYFINNIKNYVGKAVLFLDFEDSDTTNAVEAWGVTGAKKFLDEVYSLTGVRPMIYMGLADENKYDWSSVTKDYALWVAQYNNYKPVNGFKPRDLYGHLKHFKSMAMLQYTSSGRLSGYNGNLDFDVFYGDAKAWDKFAKASGSSTPSKPATPNKPAPKPKPSDTWKDAQGVVWHKQNGEFILNTAIKLRWGATVKSKLIAVLGKGSKVKYDAYCYAGGYVWIRQPRADGHAYLPTGESKGNKRISKWGTFK